jgi:hypothetical protein
VALVTSGVIARVSPEKAGEHVVVLHLLSLPAGIHGQVSDRQIE